tara:strand:+ start:431 stop:658 length:228 start_codon:yes stop_codon:yes gene_type:complete
MDTHIKKEEIKNKVNFLLHEDRLYLLQVLKNQLSSSQIAEHADGCRINLDILSNDMINKIHHIVTTKLETSKTII